MVHRPRSSASIERRRRGRPPRRPRRQPSSIEPTLARCRRSRSGSNGSERAGAAPQPTGDRRDQKPSRVCSRACPTSPASTRLFTRRCRPRQRPTRCRLSGRSAGRSAPLRLSRALARLRIPAGRRAARAPARRAAPGHGASRRRGVAGRRPGRSLDRHDDGLHAARRPGDGDATRAPSTLASCCGSSDRGGLDREPSGARTRARLRGLLGISGRSGDMRAIVAGVGGGRRALPAGVRRLLAIASRASIAAMAASLGGLDALVFTGGVGEGSPQVRAAAGHRLGFLGLASSRPRPTRPPTVTRS